jgi:hypothetical protein
MATIAEYFRIVDAGEGRWVILQRRTGELAGSAIRTGYGFALKDPDAGDLGIYPDLDLALRELQAALGHRILEAR